MDQAGLVGGLESVEQLEEQPGGVGHSEGTGLLALDELIQAFAGDELHDHEVDVAVVAHRHRSRQIRDENNAARDPSRGENAAERSLPPGPCEEEAP